MNTRGTGEELILSFDSTTKVIHLSIEETKEFEEWVLSRINKEVEE